MLQSIRDHLTGWVATLLFVVIMLAFAFWGIDGGDFSARTAIAQVNGEEIPLEEIRRVYRTQLGQYQQVYPEVPAEIDEQIRQRVLEGMVRDELLAQHSRKVGFRVGDDVLIRAIRNMEVFQDQGQFSPELFRTRLSLQGLSPQYFEAQMRRALRVTQLQQAIAQTAILTPDEEKQRIRLEREQRRAEWAQVKVTDLIAQTEISDEQIQARYESNSDAYMQPESVDIEYVEINLTDLSGDTVITDEQLRETYNREIEAGRFQAPEERQARHILISVDDDTDDDAAKAEAEQLLEQLNTGADFAELAAEYSDDPGSAPEGGDLGWAQRAAYVGAFADALFSMNEGELRGPVRTEFGYHILRMEGQRGGVPKAFDEVSEELRAELALKAADDEFFDLGVALADLSFENPDSLEPVAAQLQLQVKRQAGLNRAPGSGLAASQDVIDAAFSERVLDDRENSEVLSPQPEQRIVLRVADYHPASLRPLSEVSDAIRATLQAEAAQALAATRGAAALERVRTGESIATVAGELGLEYHEAENYRRNGALAPALRSALFRAPKPGGEKATIEGVALGDGSYAVYAFTEVIPGDVSNLPSPDQQLAQTGVSDLTAYIARLQNDAKIVMRPELLQ